MGKDIKSVQDTLWDRMEEILELASPVLEAPDPLELVKKEIYRLGYGVVAIHQEVTDDPMGTFIEGIFELIDQYESDTNGYHTLRAMKENARQGYYNGSRPKFGFMAVGITGRYHEG